MSSYPSQEQRVLKKPKLGPPDVYPQDPKQKEDELNSLSVKHGFNNVASFSDEYGTAQKCNITHEKFGTFFSAVIAKKTEINTLQDCKKKQQLVKDNFWPVSQRSKNAMEAWFKDLSGSKPLSQLSRKVPFFNKKEEIFSTLCEFSIPALKAAWFIKMTAVHNVAMQENKQRRKQTIDQSIEWTHALTKFMKDQLHKVQEHYHGNTNAPQTSFLTASQPSSQADLDIALKQWHYCCRLCRYLYDEGLLDRHEFLSWLIDLLEKMKQADETVVKLIMAQILQYLDDVTDCCLLSRRLAHSCAKRLTQLYTDSHCSSPRTQSPLLHNNNTGNMTSTGPNPNQLMPNPLATIFSEYYNCPQHRGILLNLSSILQTITLQCPTSLIWNNLGEGKGASVLSGSPLDLLPCSPSSLPMPPGPHSVRIREQTVIRNMENMIRIRSRAAEVRWSSDKCQQSATGFVISKVIGILDILDRHHFNIVDTNNSIDTLYNKIFSINQNKDGNEPLLSDDPIVKLLIDWAVSTKRYGNYRGIVVARLLEKRQHEINKELSAIVMARVKKNNHVHFNEVSHFFFKAIAQDPLLEQAPQELSRKGCQKYGEADGIGDKESVGSDTMISPGVPLFQQLLMGFLDHNAPVLDDVTVVDNRKAFSNLIQLFCELIRYEIFSHDAYMCTLISRGDLTSSPSGMLPTADSIDLSSIKSMNESIKHEHTDDIKVDIDINTMEADLGSLFSCVKEESKSSPEPPRSVQSVKSEKEPTAAPANEGQQQQNKGSSRHMNFTTHFPIPQDEDSVHECCQRIVLLYGFGKSRDDARHVLKKFSKEIVKLFSKKNCIDISSGDLGKSKKKKEKEGDNSTTGATASVTMPVTNFDSLFSKFQKLSYYDQHAVTAQCANACLEHISNFSVGNSCYLPVVENISYLFDLMEHALNINGLLEFAIQLLPFMDLLSCWMCHHSLGADMQSFILLCDTHSWKGLSTASHKYQQRYVQLLSAVLKLLKDLRETENQLKQKSSNLAGMYTNSVCLCIVAFFRKYHNYLLVCQDLMIQAFEGLIGVVKNVQNPGDCTSSERCVLAYLYDTYSTCSYIKDKFADIFSSAYTKMKVTLYAQISPSASNLKWDPAVMMDYFNNIRTQPDPQLVKQLNENPSLRYSFVVSSMLYICNMSKADRLNDISILCAELTSRCNALSSEWLGILKALCCSANHSCGFIDVLTQIDVSDLSMHDPLAVFTAIMIARHCFSLQDLVNHVAFPSLLALVSKAEGDQDAEPGARLTCHLLLRLFEISHLVDGEDNTPGISGGNRSPCIIKASCDKLLLAASHDEITVGAVVAVLKAMLVLDVSHNDESKSMPGSSNNGGSAKSDDIISNLLSSIEDDMEMDLVIGTGTKGGKGGVESAGLSEFSKHALKEMCGQDWVREKFLKDPDALLSADLLLDSMLSTKQTQQLLQMICYPTGIINQSDQSEPDTKQTILRLLKSLDQWSLRVSWLELQLMFEQASTQTEKNAILDNIAKGTIELFHQQSEIDKNRSTDQSQRSSESDNNVWLVAPLIAKLPTAVQGRVLKLAGQVLESGNNFLSKKIDKEKNERSKSLLDHQPFLSLILNCLKGQDEQRENLLGSIHNQLEKSVCNAKDMLDKSPDEGKIRQNMHEVLQLRLSLVGGMFDTIQRNLASNTDWAILMVELITLGVVDYQSNSELFTNIIDMLSVLIHGTLLTDGQEKEENKRSYMNLIKKLKKEIADKNSDSIDQLRQLLPLSKVFYEVINCEPHGTLVDTKGNRIAGFDSIGKKQGLQVASKTKVSPWDVIEGHKNPTPLNWTSFGAVKMEKKSVKYEDQFRLLMYHTHSMKKPLSYYLEPPPLPPEDLEPHVEKAPEDKPREQTETQVMDTNKKSSKKRNRTRSNRSPYSMQPPGRQTSYNQDMYQQPPANWYGPPPQQQQPPQQQYFSPISTQGNPRITPQQQYSKQILGTILRARHPTSANQSSYMQGPGNAQVQMQLFQKSHQNQLIRQQLRDQFERNKTSRHMDNQGMYQNPMPNNGPHVGMHQMTSQSNTGPGMSQGGYASYNSMQQQQQQHQPNMMDSMNSGMMSQNYNPSYIGGQNPSSMMQPMSQQQGYMSQQPPQGAQQASYNPSGRMPPQMNSGPMQSSSVNMGGMSSYNQIGASNANQQPQNSGYMQHIPTPQQQQHHQRFLRQQQMMNMRQKGQTPQQQQTAALVAQLQRQMTGPPPGPPQAPQYNYQPPQY